MINATAITITEHQTEQKYDPYEEHVCKGGMTETWLVPDGSEFWLVFSTEPKTFTWIEYCPYCGYRPPNLRRDWGNSKTPEIPMKSKEVE